MSYTTLDCVQTFEDLKKKTLSMTFLSITYKGFYPNRSWIVFVLPEALQQRFMQHVPTTE